MEPTPITSTPATPPIPATPPAPPIVVPVGEMGTPPPPAPVAGGEVPPVGKMEAGGEVPNTEGINWVFVVVVGLGVAAAITTIVLMRRKLKAESEVIMDHRLAISDMNKRLKQMDASKKKPMNS